MADVVTAGTSASTDAPARYAKKPASHLERFGQLTELVVAWTRP